jgi:hypothetical protein
MQIALRSGKRAMAHIGREHRQLRIEVCGLAAPAQQRMDGKGMPKIMNARPLAPTGVRDPAPEQQFPVEPINRRVTPGATVWRWKEVRGGWTGLEAGGVLPQAQHQGQGGRNQAILAKFALAHGQDTSVKVNIGHAQMQHFAKSEPAAIQQAEDFGHDEVAQWRVRGWRELIDRVQ